MSLSPDCRHTPRGLALHKVHMLRSVTLQNVVGVGTPAPDAPVVEIALLRFFKRSILGAGSVLIAAAIVFGALLAWPDLLFAYSLGTGKIVVASDRPIPSLGGERFLRDCERLLDRSPLKATANQYHVYITNENWRHRLFFLPSPEAWGVTYSLFGGPAFLSRINFETGRVVHWEYVGTPPRTAAWLCAHELTHIILETAVDDRPGSISSRVFNLSVW
jgi:hypothetical protein